MLTSRYKYTDIVVKCHMKNIQTVPVFREIGRWKDWTGTCCNRKLLTINEYAANDEQVDISSLIYMLQLNERLRFDTAC